jgi:hypothetical protein
MGGTTGGTSGGADGGGPAAAGDGGTGGWTPESLAGLMLWLDPSVGVTDANGAVLTWRDRSSVHHLAASDSGFEGPRLDLKTFSGLPVVRFDGVDDRLVVQDAPSLRLGYDDFALALVVSSAPGPDPGDDGRVLFSKQDPTYPFLGLGLMVNAHRFITYVHQQVNIWSPIAGAPQYDDNRIRIVGVHRHGTELDLRVNSAIVGTAQDTDIPNASALGFPIRLGAGHTNQFLHGLIAEVVLSRVDSEEEVMQIDRYLQTKYAAALANASQ